MRLCAQKIRFRLIYPATLLVNFPEGAPRSYNTVIAAEKGTLDLLQSPHRGDSPSPHQAHMEYLCFRFFFLTPYLCFLCSGEVPRLMDCHPNDGVGSGAS